MSMGVEKKTTPVLQSHPRATSCLRRPQTLTLHPRGDRCLHALLGKDPGGPQPTAG